MNLLGLFLKYRSVRSFKQLQSLHCLLKQVFREPICFVKFLELGLNCLNCFGKL